MLYSLRTKLLYTMCELPIDFREKVIDLLGNGTVTIDGIGDSKADYTLNVNVTLSDSKGVVHSFKLADDCIKLETNKEVAKILTGISDVSSPVYLERNFWVSNLAYQIDDVIVILDANYLTIRGSGISLSGFNKTLTSNAKLVALDKLCQRYKVTARHKLN